MRPSEGPGWIVFAAISMTACGPSAVPARTLAPPGSPAVSASAPVPSAQLASAPSAPTPLPACVAVEVEDHSAPASDVRANVVREAMRQKLTALAVCARPYHLRVDVTVEQVGAAPLRARLRAVVYRKAGEVAGDIPTTVSAQHAAPEDRTSAEADLLRSGAERVAQVFADNFH